MHTILRRSASKWLAVSGLAAAIGVLPIGTGMAGAQTASGGGTTISTATGAFGKMLVVGSGQYAGYTLYYITSDAGGNYGCTTVAASTPAGPITCTGPAGSQTEWPAITTTGAPVAGPGVRQSLLGTVTRSGIGQQITYAGHPLYMFDMGAGMITGEGYDEATLPPWHGVWWLLSPSGRPLAWPGMLTTTTIHGRTVVAALALTLAGWEPYPVYSYSKDSSTASACNGSCATSWPAVLTSGRGGVSAGLSQSSAGAVHRGDGSTQLSYKGKPLYFFSLEQVTPTGTSFTVAGNGNGVKVAGGTFRLVTP